MQPLAVVPPMSKENTPSRSERFAMFCAIDTPATGPDSSNKTGIFLARSVSTTPPVHVIKSSFPEKFLSARRVCEIVDVTLNQWFDV